MQVANCLHIAVLHRGIQTVSEGIGFMPSSTANVCDHNRKVWVALGFHPDQPLTAQPELDGEGLGWALPWVHSSLGARTVLFVRLSVGFPLADVRPFVEGPTHRLDRPPWDLISHSDFLRNFGAGVDAGREGGWLPFDRRFLEADHGIRLPDSLSSVRFGDVDGNGLRGFACRWRGRRLRPTATTHMLRAEMEFFRSRTRRDRQLTPGTILAMVEDFLDLQVTVGKRHRCVGDPGYVTPDGRSLPTQTALSQIGPYLASLYLTSTTSSNANSSLDCPSWWVSAGSTLVVVELDYREIIELPNHRPLALTEIDGPLTVGYLRAGRFGAHVLLVTRWEPGTDVDQINRLRDLIRHAHAESDTVAHVLRMLISGNLRLGTPDSEESFRLIEYLDRATQALESPDWFGFPTTDLLAALYSALGWGTPTQRNQLLKLLDEQKTRLGSRLSAVRSTWAAQGQGDIYIRNVERLEAKMEKSQDTYVNQGQAGAFGPGAHASQFNQSMTNVWNGVAGDIPLDKLAQELATLREALKTAESGPDEDGDRDIAVGEVRQAEKAAQSNDGPGALEHLKSAGSWVLKVATSVGVPIAVAAIKAALGIPA
jgi:hypothetical protein